MEGFESNGNGTSNESTPSGGIYVLVVVLVLTAVCSVLGNLLVQVAFWRTKSLKASAPATLVMVLAFVDFCMAILVMPFVVSTALHGEWYQSHGLCVASGFMNTFLTAIQFGVLFSISINRFTAISFPHRYQQCKNNSTYLMISLVVGHSLLWSIMPFLGWGGYDYIQGTLFCNINWSEHKSHSTSLFVFCYIIPAVIAALLYITVYVKIRKMGQSPIAQLRMSSQLDLRIGQMRREENSYFSNGNSNLSVCDPNASPSKKGNVYNSRGSLNTINRIFHGQRSRESRVTTSLLLVAAAFAIFWLPRGLVNLSAVIGGRDSVPKAVEYLTSVFIFMSSFVNPIIYALFHYEYNRAFKQILRCTKKCVVGSK